MRLRQFSMPDSVQEVRLWQPPPPLRRQEAACGWLTPLRACGKPCCSTRLQMGL